MTNKRRRNRDRYDQGGTENRSTFHSTHLPRFQKHKICISCWLTWEPSNSDLRMHPDLFKSFYPDHNLSFVLRLYKEIIDCSGLCIPVYAMAKLWHSKTFNSKDYCSITEHYSVKALEKKNKVIVSKQKRNRFIAIRSCPQVKL